MPASTRSRSLADDIGTPSIRRKVESEQPEDAPLLPAAVETPEHSTDFWFDEGNVIISARQKSFKLHTSILMLHSEVFKTLLNSAALAQLQERLDSCPVLRVDDMGTDFEDLLHIIYNGANSPWFDRQEPPIGYNDFRVIVKIAVKYEVKEIIKEAKHRLSWVFPADAPDKWDPDLQPDGDNTSVALTYPDCIDVLSLARMLDMRSTLPLIFYACSNIDDDDIFAKGTIFHDEHVRLSTSTVPEATAP
ncbi:BTB/POZ domain-containing protein [Phanerochaete sordida]|uniref:BTB/POZ domain-containing protein n=1 Tax=Phanerochaete sordida TaxID=48140 RepID=A0A9P3G8U4_9APHY|nr:BTB/POZ domain-containing protein [Phanerochaete sordida]